MFRSLAALAAAIFSLTIACTAQSQNRLDARQWLPAGSKIETTLAERPARYIRQEMAGGRMGYTARLGELVFRSPITLGRDAARQGLSCDACHPNGSTNTRFFVPGSSDKPGNVDVSHPTFFYRENDGLTNPVNIPSVRGIRTLGPYGRDGRFGTLAAFSRNVIMREFGGPDPENWILDALVAYQMSLAEPPNRFLTPDGRLTKTAPDGAREGEKLFRRDCAECHEPRSGFADPRRYDVGTGGRFEAPSLLATVETAPYFNDGRADTLAEAMDVMVANLGLAYSAADRTRLLTYLETIGAMDRRFSPETLPGDLARLSGFLELLRQPLLDEDMHRADVTADMLRMEIGRVFFRYRNDAGAARTAIRGWADQLSDITRLNRAGQFPAARKALTALLGSIEDDRETLKRDIAASLYTQ